MSADKVTIEISRQLATVLYELANCSCIEAVLCPGGAGTVDAIETDIEPVNLVRQNLSGTVDIEDGKQISLLGEELFEVLGVALGGKR